MNGKQYHDLANEYAEELTEAIVKRALDEHPTSLSSAQHEQDIRYAKMMAKRNWKYARKLGYEAE